MEPLTLLYLGQTDYEATRTFIRTKLFPLTKQKSFLVCCEHPPTITYGKNNKNVGEGELAEADLKKIGFKVLKTDRGGQTTYHGPGQLMFYPITDLRRVNIGIRFFVDIVQQAVLDSLKDISRYSLFLDTNQPGLWAEYNGAVYKMGSCGFRIIEGISEHGFSLNFEGDLSPYKLFNPCGVKGQMFINLIDTLIEKPIEESTLRLKYLIINRVFFNLSKQITLTLNG